MNWKTLLSLKRYGDKKERLRKEQLPTRVGFDVDYDRVVFSTPFRSLQGKTQVIPLPKKGFVHNRLTHSLETSSVGRSLGREVGVFILEKHPDLAQETYTPNDFGSIVATACLAHDIGNPPFGHFGEKAIGHYFSHGKGKRFQGQLNDLEWNDLIHFEGNANGFKILTQNANGIDGALRLSYATLGAFTKYPKDSKKLKMPKIWQKKYGYFQSEKEQFKDVAESLGLIGNETNGWCRHPLSYLVEAADDICYSIIDFEDGINLGWIDEDKALELFIPLVGKYLDREKYYKLTKKSDRIGYLRALAIGQLVKETVAVFVEFESELLAGTFNASLVNKTRFEIAIKELVRNAVKDIYNRPKVLEVEASGFEVIQFLMNTFVDALEDIHSKNPAFYSKHIIKLLPEDLNPDSHMNTYDLLMEVSHFVAGLTDNYAVDLYRKLKAIDL